MLRVEQIPNKGRGYISNVDIDVGTVMMNANGFVFVESQFIKWRHVERATREFEIATQQAYDCYVLLSIVKSKAANESLFSEFEKLFPSNIEQIKSESPDKLERAMWAGESFLKYFLELCNQTNLKTDEDVALLKLKFDFNSHNEGGRSGCFPEASYFNHNCEPNSKCSFTDDDKLQVRAISKITANSELSISYVYLPPFEQDSRESLEERQEYLQKHFLFKCNCERCQKLMKM